MTKNDFYRYPTLREAKYNRQVFRRSHWRCSEKKDVLKDLANFTGKHLCWSLFLIKLQSPSSQAGNFV